MTRRYARPAGVIVQPVGNIWAAFSETSGETLLLNDEGAAVLEVLAQGVADLDDIVGNLSVDSGVGRSAIAAALTECWSRLIEAGLVREVV